MLRKVYVKIPFYEALKEELSYLKFLRELLSNKGKLAEVRVAPLDEVCSAIGQNKSSSKL